MSSSNSNLIKKDESTLMKILFVVRSIGLGGATKQLALTANALAERGHCVGVFTYDWTERNALLSDRVVYMPVAKVSNGKIEEYFRSPFLIRKAIKQFQPDVTVSWRTNCGCFTVLAAMGLPTKVVFSERTDPFMETSTALKIAGWVCNFSDGGVFQTENAKNYYKRLANKSVVIPNPFQYPKELPDVRSWEERNKEIVMPARFFLVQKRHDVLFDMFKIVLKSYPEYKLALYGDGPDKDKVKRLVTEKALEDTVIFKGVVADVVDAIKNSKLLVLSSDYEGIPNVILEAFAAGVPVVTTDCSPGGARILIDDGKEGYIVPIRDSKALSEKAIRVLENKQIAESFIVNGRAKLDAFKTDVIINKWENYLWKFV